MVGLPGVACPLPGAGPLRPEGWGKPKKHKGTLSHPGEAFLGRILGKGQDPRCHCRCKVECELLCRST